MSAAPSNARFTWVPPPGGLRLPAPWVILCCLLLFAVGETAGAALGGFPQPIMQAARTQALARPSVHGLAGVPDIDRAILEGVETEVLARIHTFHPHAHGLAIVVFLLTFLVTNAGFAARVASLSTAMLCVGLLYPFGWLAMALAVPVVGQSDAFRLAERAFFIPFGGTFLLAVWLIVVVYATQILRGRTGRP